MIIRIIIQNIYLKQIHAELIRVSKYKSNLIVLCSHIRVVVFYSTYF